MTLQDRPTAAELVEAVREFLERDVMGAIEGRVRFHTRVALNALGIVERELVAGPAADAEALEHLRAVLGHDGEPRELVADLARGIRDGSLDARRTEVLAAVRALVRAKLTVANPGYLEA